jgi:hypothetical protein
VILQAMPPTTLLAQITEITLIFGILQPDYVLIRSLSSLLINTVGTVTRWCSCKACVLDKLGLFEGSRVSDVCVLRKLLNCLL